MITIGNIKVDESLVKLVEDEMLPLAKMSKEKFWSGFESIIEELTPQNKALLETRDELQLKIDEWHKNNKFSEKTFSEYKSFLKEIEYLVSSDEEFKVDTKNVDTEICLQAGPQLVVPVKNARFALNAANARWGSLYDALYGTDVISKEGNLAITKEYNKLRGNAVVKYVKEQLDIIAPLKSGSHNSALSYKIVDGKLQVELENKEKVSLISDEKLVGYEGEKESPSKLVFKNNNLHAILVIDKESFIGKQDAAGVSDVILEAAVTTIMDCEDSIAAVDAEDKVEVYRNWLGLMKGDLQESFEKGGKTLTRVLNEDKVFKTLNDEELVLHGRSLLFVRNVGHLMTNPAILDKNGDEVFEGIMDAMITTLAAMIDLKGENQKSNSRTKSLYIVKPKMHGPQEVAFAVKLFSRVEEALELPSETLKIGIMDEERRTSINLKECIKAAKSRVVFINTGFLDRTGDEIHTSMLAGAITPKREMKKEKWISAYEKSNVVIGLECGLQGKAQIGKGMWAMPDEMAKMMEEKVAHPNSGANTAWVPSPTAAVLHALHYHKVNVVKVQNTLKGDTTSYVDNLLQIPLLDRVLTKEEIKEEIDNNVQGILGYVVRWIDMGIGCSKVPDINNIALMEDRATLRISSQHLANWCEHGICSEDDVMLSLKEMAKVVDKQNEGEAGYINMAPTYDGIAFQAACDLIFKGKEQPAGYTEPLLHKYRRVFKEQN